MSHSNFGERYLTVRDQLVSLMSGIASLARDVSLDPADFLPLADLRSGLVHPFVFAACGETNAGKSALINALAGLPLCPTNAVPGPFAIRRYRHGANTADAKLDAAQFDCLRPHDALRDFHWIDTPGLSTVGEAHVDCIRNALGGADLILCVLHVENPWGAAAWEFLSRSDAASLSRTVLVIQQADLRTRDELRVIRGHVEDLCRKRLDRPLPVFVASALRGIQSKQRHPVDLPGWQASGIAALEQHLDAEACRSAARWAMLIGWRDQAESALKAIEDRMEDRIRRSRDQSRFLDEIEGEIDAICEKFIKRLPHHLAEVANVFEQEARDVTRVLSRRLAVLPSVLRLFTRVKVGRAIEDLFVERLKAAVESVANQDATEVRDYCRLHWQALAPRVRDVLGISLGDGSEMAETMNQSRAAFVNRLGAAAGEAIGKLSVRRHLDQDLRLRHASLNSYAMATLLFATAAGICGALGLHWLPWLLCGLAGLFVLGGLAAAVATRRSIVRAHGRSLEDACGGFASTLRGDYEDALRLIFRDYAQCLGDVRRHLVRENQAIEPRQRRWQEMLLHLKAIEQEL